jgi:DNA-binding response OmpR family regulator
MKSILLCTYDPLLLKGLYGPLMDDGYSVEAIDHPAEAVKRTLRKRYGAVILDSDGIGLDARDAALIIKNISPGIHILTIGQGDSIGGSYVFEKPVDIEKLRSFLREIIKGKHKIYAGEGGFNDTKGSHT